MRTRIIPIALALAIAAPVFAGKAKPVDAKGATPVGPISCEKEETALGRCRGAAETVADRCDFACLKKYQYRFGAADRILAAECSQSCSDRFEASCAKPSAAVDRCRDAAAAAAELAACAERWGEGTSAADCKAKDDEASRAKAEAEERKRAAVVHCGRFKVPSLGSPDDPGSGEITDERTGRKWTRIAKARVDHREAMAFCAERQMRLPTIEEGSALLSCCELWGPRLSVWTSTDGGSTTYGHKMAVAMLGDQEVQQFTRMSNQKDAAVALCVDGKAPPTRSLAVKEVDDSEGDEDDVPAPRPARPAPKPAAPEKKTLLPSIQVRIGN